MKVGWRAASTDVCWVDRLGFYWVGSWVDWKASEMVDNWVVLRAA